MPLKNGRELRAQGEETTFSVTSKNKMSRTTEGRRAITVNSIEQRTERQGARVFSVAESHWGWGEGKEPT